MRMPERYSPELFSRKFKPLLYSYSYLHTYIISITSPLAQFALLSNRIIILIKRFALVHKDVIPALSLQVKTDLWTQDRLCNLAKQSVLLLIGNCLATWGNIMYWRCDYSCLFDSACQFRFTLHAKWFEWISNRWFVLPIPTVITR